MSKKEATARLKINDMLQESGCLLFDEDGKHQTIPACSEKGKWKIGADYV